jgi:hypothetical protein
VLLFAGRISAG